MYKLLSYYPGKSGGSEYQDSRGWALEKWMDEHLHRCGEIYSADLDSDPFFTLCTETPESMEHLFQVQIPREKAKQA